MTYNNRFYLYYYKVTGGVEIILNRGTFCRILSSPYDVDKFSNGFLIYAMKIQSIFFVNFSVAKLRNIN